VANSWRCGSNTIDLSNWFNNNNGLRSSPLSPRADLVKVDDVDINIVMGISCPASGHVVKAYVS